MSAGIIGRGIEVADWSSIFMGYFTVRFPSILLAPQSSENLALAVIIMFADAYSSVSQRAYSVFQPSLPLPLGSWVHPTV